MPIRNLKYFFILGALVIGALTFSKLGQIESNDIENSRSDKEASLAPFSSQGNHEEEKDQDQDQTPDALVSNNDSENTITENAVDTQKMQLLNQILIAKNDNDPRLDHDFKNLSPSFKKILMNQYMKYKPEQRNEKGMVAFIVSRELNSVDELDSLKIVFQEPPCQSLSNCSREDSNTDPHHSGLTNVDLNYPQMVTLYQIEQKIKQGLFKSEEEKTDLKKFLSIALNHPSKMVSQKASEIIKKHSL